MGPLPVVSDEKRLTRLESPIDMDDRAALPIGSGDDPIAGLEDETAA
jgi:hypothetical protein